MRPARASIAVLLLGSAALSGCSLTGAMSSAPWNSAPTPTLTTEPTANLTAPEGLRATSGELRAIPLKWEPLLVGDVGGYVLERSAAREGPFEQLAVIPGRLATRYVDRNTISAEEGAPEIDVASAPIDPPASIPQNLEDGVTWFYRTRAFSPSGSLAEFASPVVTGTTAPPPGAPENLRTYSRQPRNVPVSWSASDDPLVAGYRVERSPTARGPYELLAQIEGRHETTYVDRGLGDLRVFYYRVTALNPAGGLGEPTAPVQAVTKPEPLPPVNLHATERRLGANVLAWDHNVEPDIVTYRVIRTLDGGDPELVASVGYTETSATDDAVGAGEWVEYSIEAVDRDGLVSDAARNVAVESESYALSANAQSDGVHLVWNPRTDEGFRGAHVSRLGLVSRTNLGFSTDGRYVDPDVAPGGTYRYSVVLERVDESLAPRSQTIEVVVPDSGETP